MRLIQKNYKRIGMFIQVFNQGFLQAVIYKKIRRNTFRRIFLWLIH